MRLALFAFLCLFATSCCVPTPIPRKSYVNSSVSGRVVDFATNKPLANAEVSLLGAGSRDSNGCEWQVFLFTRQKMAVHQLGADRSRLWESQYPIRK